MTTILLVIAVFLLAFSNGANDNFKGVATLYGSNTTSFRGALAWATGATLLGSLASVVLAQGLVKTFSGAGLIDGVSLDVTMFVAIGGSAAVTILLATLLGMPTSTTHALIGALVGTGLMAAGGHIQWNTLAYKFAQPMLLSPIMAIVITAGLYSGLRRLRLRMGVTRKTCLCVGEGEPQFVAISQNGTATLPAGPGGAGTVIQIDDTDQCVERYGGQVVGVKAQTVVDSVHYLSGAAVCFARAVNDTPKIAAILLVTGGVAGAGIISGKLLFVALAMVAGGLIRARKVAETMSKNITNLNPGQGLTANLVTAMLVLGASRLGVPVSTTHVSCGSIFGIGLMNSERGWKTIGRILTTWLTTLPMGVALGAAFYGILQGLAQ